MKTKKKKVCNLETDDDKAITLRTVLLYRSRKKLMKQAIFGSLVDNDPSALREAPVQLALKPDWISFSLTQYLLSAINVLESICHLFLSLMSVSSSHPITFVLSLLIVASEQCFRAEMQNHCRSYIAIFWITHLTCKFQLEFRSNY